MKNLKFWTCDNETHDVGDFSGNMGVGGKLLSLHLASSVIFVFLVSLTTIMYKRLDYSNSFILLKTSYLLFPCIVMPLFLSREVTMRGRYCRLMLGCLGAFVCFIGLGLSLKYAHSNYRIYFFLLLSVCCMICYSGSENLYRRSYVTQAMSEFLRIGLLSCEISSIIVSGGVVVIAGVLEVYTRQSSVAWRMICFFMALCFLILGLYYCFMWRLWKGERQSNKFNRYLTERGVAQDKCKHKVKRIFLSFIGTIVFVPQFFFLKVIILFLLDRVTVGGLGLSTADVGMLIGIVGVVAVIVGTFCGNIMISKLGLRYNLQPMSVLASLILFICIFLAYYQFRSFVIIAISLFVGFWGMGCALSGLVAFIKKTNHAENNSYLYSAISLGVIFAGVISSYMLLLGYLNCFIGIAVLVFPLSYLSALFFCFYKENPIESK